MNNSKKVVEELIAFASGTEDIDSLSMDELDERLRLNGIDPGELRHRTDVWIAAIRARLDAQEETA